MRWAILLMAGCGGRHGDSSTPAGSVPTGSELVANAGPDVAGEVGTPIRFDGSASVGAHFAWDFGDGTTAEGAVAEHAYADRGNYTAVLQVFDAGGAFRTDTALAVAHGALTERGVSGSTAALAEEGGLWVADRDGGGFYRGHAGGKDTSTSSPCTRIASVAAAPGRLAVSCAEPEQLALADSTTWTWTDIVPLGTGAHPEAVVPDGTGWAVVLRGTGEIARIDGGAVVERISVDDPRGVVGGVGLYAARYRSIDGEGRIGGDADIALAFDPGPDSDTTIRGVPTGMEHLALSADGEWLYASGTLANTARGLFRDGQIPTFETSVRAFVDAVDPATGDRRWRKQFDDRGMAGAMALSALDNWLFVAFPTTGDVLVLDAWSGDIVSSILGAGLGIRGMAVDGDTLFVHAWLDREVRAFDLTDLSSPALLWSTSLGPELLPAEVARGRRVFWDASDTRMAKAGYLSCAVCHPDGEHDGQTWDFTDRGEGLRNTTSLLGRGGTAMGPLHWTANFDEVQDFEHDIRYAFGGSGFIAENTWAMGSIATTLGDPKAGVSADLDALATYLTSLDVTPVSPFAADPVGEALFVTAGCDGCHPAPLFTDSPSGLRHDVGTLGPGSGQRLGGTLDGLDTPTLLGAWQTGPWLHDGSAASLEEAIGAHASGLSPTEIASLSAFVRSL